MSVLRRYLWREQKRNIISVILEILSLFAATMILYLNLNLSDDVYASMKEETRRVTHGFDVRVEAADGSVLPLSRFDDLKQDAVLPVSVSIADLGNISGINYYVMVHTLPGVMETHHFSDTVEGRLPQTAGECAVTAAKARTAGIGVGSTVRVQAEDGTMSEWTVTGLLSSFALYENARPDVLELICHNGNAASAQNVYLDTELAGTTPEETEKTLTGCKVTSLLSEKDVRDEIQNFRSVLLLINVIVLLLASFLIMTLCGNRMETRLHDYAMCRSIGASRLQWLRLLFEENIAYALTGALVGVATGEPMRSALMRGYYELNGAPQTFSVKNAVLAVAFTVTFVLLITAVASTRFVRKSIRESLFDYTTSAYAIRYPQLIAGAILMSGGFLAHALNTNYAVLLNEAALGCIIIGAALCLPNLLSLCADFAAKKICGLGNGTVFLALKRVAVSKTNVGAIRLLTASVVLTTLFIFSVSSVNAFFRQYEGNYDYDIYVRGADINDEVCRAVEQQPFVAAVRKEYWRRNTTVIDDHPPINVCFVRKGGYINGIDLIDTSDDVLTNGTVIMDEVMAKRYHLRVGDTFPLITESHGGGKQLIERDFTVGGLCDSGVYNTKRMTILLGNGDYDDLIGSLPERIDIILADGYDAAEVLASLQYMSAFRFSLDIEVGIGNELYNLEFSRTVAIMSAFSVLPILVTAMAAAGILNNQWMSYRRNKREFAVLYSTAMNKKQLFAVVILECVFTYAAGALPGALLSFGLVYVLRDVIYALIAYIPISVSPWVPLLLFFGVGTVFTVCSLIPCASVLRMDTAQELKRDT